MRIALFFSLIVIFVFACDSGEKIFEKGKYIPGYTFNKIPNSIQTNGYIYGINKNTKDLLYLTTITMPSVEGDVSLPSGTRLTKTDFSTLLNWLGNRSPSISASGNVTLTSEITMNLEFDNAKMVETPVLDATKSIREAVEKIRTELKKIVNVDEYEFYLIVSTIKAKKLEYTFEKKVADDVNFKVNVEKIADVNPEFKLDKNRLTKLQFEDTAYRNVLYKALPLLVNNSLTGDYEIKLQTGN